MTDPLDALIAEYPAWWIDFLGEHNHIGGIESTIWLLERAGLQPGARMLDCGAFVGAAARLAAERCGADAVAIDLNTDFLITGRAMAGGGRVWWVTANARRLPFCDGAFASVWCLDSDVAPKELSRVASSRATLCLCCEVPVDSRGGVEAFIDEWAEFGWALSAHKQLSSDATQLWRKVEAELVRRRPFFEERYSTRGYLAQLDLIASMVRSYEVGEQGHGLFVFAR
ncbi:MAG: class I SAM-dependent methyltransferase [Tepidiformaceae bacterium]